MSHSFIHGFSMCFGTFLPEKTANLLFNSVMGKGVKKLRHHMRWRFIKKKEKKKARSIKVMLTFSLSYIFHSSTGQYNMFFYFPIRIDVSLFSHYSTSSHVSQLNLCSSQCKISIFFLAVTMQDMHRFFLCLQIRLLEIFHYFQGRSLVNRIVILELLIKLND